VAKERACGSRAVDLPDRQIRAVKEEVAVLPIIGKKRDLHDGGDGSAKAEIDSQ
jgi:hypothetical protein